MEDKFLIKIWCKEKEYGEKRLSKMKKLVCRLRNKHLLNKVNQTKVAVYFTC